MYNIYAWVSGAKDKMANRRTNLMMEEIRKDAQMIKNQPYLITGDLNGLPPDFDVLPNMCAQGDLHDVAPLRQSPARTRMARRAARQRRRRRATAGILCVASTTALPLVVSLSIDKEGAFPTHKPVTTELRTNTLKTGANMKVPVYPIPRSICPGMRRGSWTFGG